MGAAELLAQAEADRDAWQASHMRRVHLVDRCYVDQPTPLARRIDTALNARVATLRQVVDLG